MGDRPEMDTGRVTAFITFTETRPMVAVME